MPAFCDVALPLPLDTVFTYRVNGQQPVVGGRVLVPFRTERLPGVVVALHDIGGLLAGDRQVVRDSWLIPLRDIIAVLVRSGSYTGRTVSWRGRRFTLKDKKLRPA